MELSDYAVDTRYTGMQYGSNQSSFHSTDYPSSRAETPSLDAQPILPNARSHAEILQLFQTAVDNSRAAAVKSNAESEAMESSISLNVDLKNQNITTIPEEVVDVMKKDHGRIIGLVLTGNFITDLPQRISEFSLTYLNLRGNNLSDFPPVILSLSKLEVLDLSRNFLSEIPKDITLMKKLRFLSIRNNRLTDLPRSIGSADHLRIIKLDNNPLTEPLASIVSGEHISTSSPSNVPLNESDKAFEVTQQIKNYLKESSKQIDSELGSQSESPLETPRVTRRTSMRFPVKLANGNISESGLEPRSPGPGMAKPVIPNRSKQRVLPASNGFSSVGRRPGAIPLNLTNERNRSQSESAVQAAANARNKRMGMMSSKKLDSLEEVNGGRNSLHFRGASHASALRDRHDIYRSALGSGSTNSVSPITEMPDDAFYRRLSSIPERRIENSNTKRLDQIARGLLYAMDVYTAHLKRFLAQVDSSQDKNLVNKLGLASLTLRKLDTGLAAFDKAPPDTGKSQRKAAKVMKKLCMACISAYKVLLEATLDIVGPLSQSFDGRHIRTLTLLFYISCNEVHNSILLAIPESTSKLANGVTSQGITTSTKSIQSQPPPRLTIQAVSSTKPTSTSPASDSSRSFTVPVRRFRSDTLTSVKTGSTVKPPPMPQSAIPAYARSRSNSRSNHFGPSAMMANTPPRTGESLLMPRSINPQTSPDYDQVELEKVYGSISTTVSQCYTKMSELISKIELRRDNVHALRDMDACERVIGKFRTLKNTCEAIHKQMVKVKLNDPNPRRFRELCQSFIEYVAQWEMFVTSMVPEKKLHPEVWSSADMKELRPLHEKHKVGAADAQNYLNKANYEAQQSWSLNGSNGNLPVRQNGHERYGRGDSNSSIASPYIPTTPLSAALGPAAQVTVPAVSTPPSVVPTPVSSTASTFDRTFRGNVFERADAYLNSANSGPFMRSRGGI